MRILLFCYTLPVATFINCSIAEVKRLAPVIGNKDYEIFAVLQKASNDERFMS